SSLVEALGWIDAAFTGVPDDVRYWPILIPLVPHALSVTAYADAAGILEPAARLMNELGMLLDAKALHTEAESLLRRALAIGEGRLGSDHPNVAARLNNLAEILRKTNQLVEAELLLRRALAIDEKNFGPDHPTVAIRLNNLGALMRTANRLVEAEALMRRALAID